jgi:hypothetical protein
MSKRGKTGGVHVAKAAARTTSGRYGMAFATGFAPITNMKYIQEIEIFS